MNFFEQLLNDVVDAATTPVYGQRLRHHGGLIREESCYPVDDQNADTPFDPTTYNPLTYTAGSDD